MIEGIQIRVTAAQLKEHYAEKILEYRKHFESCTVRIQSYEKTPESERNFRWGYGFSDCQCKQFASEQKGQLFEKLLAHLIEGETYSFTYKEAAELELLPANTALIREEKPTP